MDLNLNNISKFQIPVHLECRAAQKSHDVKSYIKDKDQIQGIVLIKDGGDEI